MSILQIRPVERTAAKLVIGLAGRSSSGKTYSALQLAHGLADGDVSKIGFLDTENGRGALYDTVLGSPFLYAELSAPFSPARYREAMLEFAAAGIDVLVIDSGSHEWEGDGGCSEIADKALKAGKRMADWRTAKSEHKAFMRTVLSLPCHTIICYRAREKTDFKDPTKPKSLGVQPIWEKEVKFELTVSYMLDNAGTTREELKSVPEFFHFLRDGKYLTRDHGQQMRAWAGAINPVERMKNNLRLAAERGVLALGEAWTALNKADKNKVGEAFKDTLKDLAAHADEERNPAHIDSGAPDSENEPF